MYTIFCANCVHKSTFLVRRMTRAVVVWCGQRRNGCTVICSCMISVWMPKALRNWPCLNWTTLCEEALLDSISGLLRVAFKG